jgi:pentatricopeptide repeat protein
VGDIDTAWDLLHDMERLGFVPRISTYNALLGACARSKQSMIAFEILGEMKGHNVAPDGQR